MFLFRSGIIFFAYLGISVYTGIRFLALVKYFLPSFRAFIFCPLYIGLCYSFMLFMFIRAGALRQAGLNIFPAVVYFFLALLVFDVVKLVLRLIYGPSSLPLAVIGTGIALFLTVFLMVYGVFHARNIHTVFYTITLDKNAGGSSMRLALVSDIHIGRTVGRKWVANVVDTINLAKPDIICLAGDIFDNDISVVRDLEGVAEEFRRLKAPLGVFACPGNHDVDRLSLGAALRDGATTNRLEEFFKNSGITFLQDEVLFVAESFYLAGRRDARPIGMKHGRKSAAELSTGLDKSRPFVIMDHQPVDYPMIEESGADLILSGHTHRGQFFPGNIATARIFKKAGAVHYGYWKGRSAQAVVSSGAGVWGPAIRVATRSEVAVLDIKFAK